MRNTPHSKFRHVYAVVRIDTPVDNANPENSVSVVKVLAPERDANQEATRLNELNGKKGCVYVVFTSRMVD
jgi:hypothetical protein